MKRLVCLTIALLLGSSVPALAAHGPSSTKIAVSGTGSLTMMPDLATVNANVTTNAASSAQALDQNNSIYNRILGALGQMGIARSDITLSYYNVNYNPKPRVVPPNPNNERYGYTVSRSFAIKVRKMVDAGKVIDATTNAGATQIDGVQFGLANDTAARGQALRAAVADARSKAAQLASAAGLHIVGIAEIAMGQGGGIIRPMMAMDTYGTAQAVPTTLDPGSVNVTVTVSVVYLAAP